MSSSKDQLLALVESNPFISQQELADQLGLSRSAVAGHLAQLTKEGRILGRAYVLPQRQPIVCIGGTNLDRKLRGLGPLRMGSSNPATQHETAGGVARNIAENLARLGLPVHLLTAVGRDAAGQSLLAQLQALGVDCAGSLQAVDAATGSYTAVLDPQGELVLALGRLRKAETLRTIPVSDYVAATSVGIVGGMPLLDLAYEEDSKADVDMNIVKTGDGRYIEIQGTAEAEPFGRDTLAGLLELADAGIAELIAKQRDIVGPILGR